MDPNKPVVRRPSKPTGLTLDTTRTTTLPPVEAEEDRTPTPSRRALIRRKQQQETVGLGFNLALGKSSDSTTTTSSGHNTSRSERSTVAIVGDSLNFAECLNTSSDSISSARRVTRAERENSGGEGGVSFLLDNDDLARSTGTRSHSSSLATPRAGTPRAHCTTRFGAPSVGRTLFHNVPGE